MSNTEKKEVVLAIDSLTKGFETPRGYISILENVNLKIYAGEKIAIIGPSGSGKSTLLSLIGLLDEPTSGIITLAGSSTNNLKDKDISRFRNEKIGFIFQSFELIAPFTTKENITAPIEIGGKKVDKAAINKLITGVRLEDRAEALPQTLSGGEKQRVAIARALANDPDIILADEPTGSLDRDTGEKVLSLLLESVAESQKTLIIITHDNSIAARMDRVFEIKNHSLHERN